MPAPCRYDGMGRGEWLDCHVHVLGGGTEEARLLSAEERGRGYAASNFLSVEGMGDAAQNALAVYYKLIDPENYAFGGMHYRFSYDFGEEAKKLYAIGLDGIKMIENKPTERKRLGYAQDDSRYDTLYEVLRELDMPLLAHVGDPAEFWDRDRIPPWALDAGYFYGGGDYPGYEDLLGETGRMLENHPGLRVCFAHFLFLADNHDRLCGLLERYPGMYLDITAGTEMYFSFTRNPDLWKAFFLRYQDRILFGTDNCNVSSGEEAYNMEVVNSMEKAFLQRDETFAVWDKQVRGIGLPEPVRKKIAVDNFRNFAGARPRNVDCAAAASYLQERLSEPGYRLTGRERDIITQVLRCCTRKRDGKR